MATVFQTDTFGNGQRSVTVAFPMAGIDDTNTISLQTGMSIDEASMRISTVQAPTGSKDYPSNVSVDVGGDGLPEWQFKGTNIGQLGRQSQFTSGASKVDMRFRTMDFNDTMAFRLPKHATVTSGKLTLSMASLARVLVIYADKDVPSVANIVTKLKAFNTEIVQVDTFDGGLDTPTMGLLRDYSACLVYISGYSGMAGYASWKNAAALGDVLADYVDSGGGVVTASFCWAASTYGGITGRFLSGGYFATPVPMSIYGGTDVAIQSILIPDHPIMKGVTSIRYSGSSSLIYMGPQTTAATGASVVFTWNTNTATVGACVRTMPNGVNRVDIQMNPWSDLINRVSYGKGYTGDGDILLKNSLVWAGNMLASGTTASPGVAVDIMKDGIIEYNVTTLMGNYTITNFASKLNDYLATAPVAYTDTFGNEFVDVPVKVTPNDRTTAIFSDLEILYRYSADFSKNPYTGDLASSLDNLQSSKPGNYNTSIPIMVSSSSPGRLLLSDLHISMHAPFHKPSITSFFPAAETVVKENSVLELGVNATDWYGVPLTYKWFYNGFEVPGAKSDRLSLPFGFEDEGTYAVKIEVSNDNGSTQQVWKVVVQNINRPPEITGFAPTSDPSILEGSNMEFSVNSSDPDNDPIGYTWTLDGKGQGSASANSFTYRTDFLSAGKHTVKVLASDPGAFMAEHEWSVSVGNVNQAPLITDWEPKDDPTIIENQDLFFTVTTIDSDKGALTTTWTIDGAPQVVGDAFHMVTDHSSAGIRTVKATVSDGDLTAVHEWKMTVLNLNRPPNAVIDSPRDMMETMQGPAIHFSGNSSSDPDGEQLSFTWKEGGAIVSDQAVFDMPFAHGFHTLVLEVRDRMGATSEATVHFRVRWVEFSLVLGTDKLNVFAGDKVGMIVTLRNVGDTGAREQKLEILVDGRPVASEDLPALAAGESARAQFQWKATKGAHTITAKIGDQTWNTPLSVAAAEETGAGPSASVYILPVLIIALAAGLVVWGRSALRKK